MKKLPPLIADRNGRVELSTALVLKSAISRTLAEFNRSLRPMTLTTLNPSPSPPKSKSPSKKSPSPSMRSTANIGKIELLDLADFENSPPARTALSKLQIKKKCSPSRDEQTNSHSHSESALMRSFLLKKGFNEDLLAKSERESLVEMRADAFKYSEREKEKKWAIMGTPKRQPPSDKIATNFSDSSPEKSAKATEQRIDDLKNQAAGIVAVLTEIESTTDAILEQFSALASRRDVLEEVLLQQTTPRAKGVALTSYRSMQEEASDAHDCLLQLEQRLRALQQQKTSLGRDLWRTAETIKRLRRQMEEARSREELKRVLEAKIRKSGLASVLSISKAAPNAPSSFLYFKPGNERAFLLAADSNLRATSVKSAAVPGDREREEGFVVQSGGVLTDEQWKTKIEAMSFRPTAFDSDNDLLEDTREKQRQKLKKRRVPLVVAGHRLQGESSTEEGAEETEKEEKGETDADSGLSLVFGPNHSFSPNPDFDSDSADASSGPSPSPSPDPSPSLGPADYLQCLDELLRAAPGDIARPFTREPGDEANSGLPLAAVAGADFAANTAIVTAKSNVNGFGVGDGNGNGTDTNVGTETATLGSIHDPTLHFVEPAPPPKTWTGTRLAGAATLQEKGPNERIAGARSHVTISGGIVWRSAGAKSRQEHLHPVFTDAHRSAYDASAETSVVVDGSSHNNDGDGDGGEDGSSAGVVESEWRLYSMSDGVGVQEFYYNKSTGESSLDRPALSVAPPIEVSTLPSPGRKISAGRDSEESTLEADATPLSTLDSSSSPPHHLSNFYLDDQGSSESENATLGHNHHDYHNHDRNHNYNRNHDHNYSHSYSYSSSPPKLRAIRRDHVGDIVAPEELLSVSMAMPLAQRAPRFSKSQFVKDYNSQLNARRS